VKQAFHIVALLAILHLAGLAGLGAYMLASGRLDAEKVEKIAAIMRGEDLEGEAKVATSQPVATPVLAVAARDKIAARQTTDEVKRLIGERLLREAADRNALANAAMLKVTRQLEGLAKERAEFAASRKLAVRADQETGQQAELAILSSLSEKPARDLLMAKPMPDAVRILMKMKKRSAAAIIEACKTEAEKAWAVQVLQEIAGQDEDRAKALAKAAR